MIRDIEIVSAECTQIYISFFGLDGCLDICNGVFQEYKEEDHDLAILMNESFEHDQRGIPS